MTMDGTMRAIDEIFQERLELRRVEEGSGAIDEEGSKANSHLNSQNNFLEAMASDLELCNLDV